jgi:arginyl-tRNA synthetase
MKGIYKRLSLVLEDILKKEFKVKLPPPLWEVPPHKKFGDLSCTVALKLSSSIKEDSLKIAAKIKNLLGEKLKKEIEKIEVFHPGFINIFICKDALIGYLGQILKNKDKFFRNNIKRKVLLEFVSANPTGPLSVAHGRQAIVGDVIARILEFFGNKVKREYYINDSGRQIELLIASVKACLKELKGEKFFPPEEGYHGEYIREIAHKYLKNKIRKDLRKFVLDYILSLIKKDLSSLKVKFDNWVSQEELIKEGKVEEVICKLRNKNLIYEKDKALWFASTYFGDDKDRVIKKKDGELTYFASDIAYHKNKAERGFDLLINLWGPDHHGYIERVKASLKALGFSEEILKVIIIQLVNLKNKERMSKRKGNIVLLRDLIETVGVDATRFYYLMRRNSSHLEFDIELALKSSFDNPLYYIQYASARIESIFRKAKIKKFESRWNKFLSDEEEFSLLRCILQFFYCLQKSYYSLEPVFVIEYLKDLASSFHKFYERKRVLEEEEKKRLARLNLLEGVRIVLDCGFNLLGIKRVKRM